MANVLYLLALLVSLTVWQSAADDACDSVECLPANGLVCALDEGTGELALFTNECVLRCANCRMDTEFKKVDIFRCSKGTKYVSVCPEVPVNNDNEDPKAEDPDDEIMVVTIDVGEEISDKVPSMFGKSAPLPLPLPLPLLAMGREILRSLVMSSQPHPPPPPPGGVTLIRADVKVDVNIHGPHRMPPPPPPRFAFPPPPPLALPVALPPPLVLAPRPRTPPPPPPQYEEPELPQQQSQPLASSAVPLAAHSAAAAAVASLLALAVAALHV